MNRDDQVKLGQVGRGVAEDLEAKRYPGAGVVLRMAQELVAGPTAEVDACQGPGCDQTLARDPSRPGPPAKYCSKRCRDRAHRGRSAA